MGRWHIENRAWQQILTHYCDNLRANDSNQVLRQDIGGGYIRCERCGETYLPETEPGNSRLLLKILRNTTPNISNNPTSNPTSNPTAVTPTAIDTLADDTPLSAPIAVINR